MGVVVVVVVVVKECRSAGQQVVDFSIHLAETIHDHESRSKII